MAEYFLKSAPLKKNRLTIGFLDENLVNDYNNQMMPGVFEAARNYHADVIRFTYYAYHSAYNVTNQINMIYNLINQFSLDGLLFLGWAKAGPMLNHPQFNRLFGTIPLLSIGTSFDSIPSVIFQGNLYLQEILLHLINIHGRKRIAFIAPVIPDNRIMAYVETMKKHNMYHPELYISEKEAGTNLANRGKQAVTILFDQRKVKPDAIVSLYVEEASGILEELQIRGIEVPEDVSVTSYEDRDLARYSSPEMTTVYFPWPELGYSGCEKMIKLLTQGHIPFNTLVPGRVIYRNSCGCMMNAVLAAGAENNHRTGKKLAEITPEEKGNILQEMQNVFPVSTFNFRTLQESFLNDYSGKTDSDFLNELTLQLRKIQTDYQPANFEDLISIFRKALLPYLLNDSSDLLWSGDLFQQAQVLVWEKIINIYGSEKINTKIYIQTLNEASQAFITNYSIESLLKALAISLAKLKIPGCYIFIFDSTFTTGNNSSNQFDTCKLVFAYTKDRRLDTGNIKSASIRQLLSFLPEREDKAGCSLAHLLHVTDAFMGFVIFEPGILDDRIYQALAGFISTGLWAVVLLEKLELSYKKLVRQAHREGMADISSEILHNIGNILNSVNTSADLMKDVIDASNMPLANLAKANQLLKQNFDNIRGFICKDVKGKKLMQFYIKLGDTFAGINSQLNYHINRLVTKVNSINNIITAQQSYAGVSEIPEELDIVAVLEDAIRLLWESLDSYKIKVIRDFRASPKVLAQSVKLFSVLVNLINNSKEAMQDTPENNRQIIFTVKEDITGKYICISDSGCGIAKNLQEQVFEYGYSTKKAGHGFGLYICAKYMTEMNAGIRVESDGPGEGAAFVLQFR